MGSRNYISVTLDITPNDHNSFIRHPSRPSSWRSAALEIVHNRIHIIAVTVDAVRLDMAALMTCVLMFDGNLGRLHAFKNADVSEMNPRVETSSVNSATFE